MNSCTRKAVHNKDIMTNITLIHIDFCFVCWLVPLLPWQSHEQCHPSSANEKTSAAAVRLPWKATAMVILERTIWKAQPGPWGWSSTGKCWAGAALGVIRWKMWHIPGTGLGSTALQNWGFFRVAELT